jgi:predicted N-acyltransferase
MKPLDYVIRVVDSPAAIPASAWNELLALQSGAGPFMRHEYLLAMHTSGCASPRTGWAPQFITLWLGDTLHAACALYLKDHSYGEYVFDWAWARAYEEHGVPYYPKALVAVPFTPVPGPRLLARDATARTALVQALVQWCTEQELSTLHLLFTTPEDTAACAEAGLMLRHTVQFHWKNVAPTLGTGVSSLPPEGERFALGRPGGETFSPSVSSVPARFANFEDFLSSLSHDKRKKIRQERRKVAEAGVTFRWARGQDISTDDWDFFYRCYERTYLEHGNKPYLSRSFFRLMAQTMPENWVLFIAERGEGDSRHPIASSLIAVSSTDAAEPTVAYGRYWGALERVDCLHFEACYYQPLQWCIDHGVGVFEGGAQGEHKMARALMPVRTTSAHWLAHPAFAEAVERFLEREGEGINHYMEDLAGRSPFKHDNNDKHGPAA